MNFRRTLANIICSFIPSQNLRRKARVVLRYPSSKTYIKWVRNWAKKNDGGVRKMSIAFGVGCQNMVVILNQRHVFKFSLKDDGHAASVREQRIMDAMRAVSPIPMPQMELIEWNGITIRKQEFFQGKMICDFTPDVVDQHRHQLAKQLANFIYTIGGVDPVAIRDLKQKKTAKPSYLYGWFHNDIGQNFMMDDNLNITGFIDWENADFCDWRPTLYAAERHWDKNGYKGLMVDVIAEYSKMYYGQ